MRTPFQRALRECSRWGIKVVVAPDDPQYKQMWSNDFHIAPQNHAGICRKTGTIIWADDDDSPLAASNMMHEMAHVIVWRELGCLVQDVDEPKHMLALEAEASRRIGASFSKGMAGYTISYDEQHELVREWPEWSTRARHDFVLRSIGACNSSYLMKDGKPTYRHTHDIINGKRVRR